MVRLAVLKDIPQMQLIRNAVKENRLSNPALVTDEDYKYYLTGGGKGWVYERSGEVEGFAIVDLEKANVWALFVHPNSEQQGIGRQLHDAMVNWYFTQTSDTLWLGTAPQTRAADFYRKAGWTETGTHGKNEIKFEITVDQWINKNKPAS